MPGLPRLKQLLRAVSGSALLNDRHSLTILMLLAAAVAAGALFFAMSEIVLTDAAGPEAQTPPIAPGALAALPAPGEQESAWMCIIIDDIGEDLAALNKLLALPYPVTLSIWPHSTHAAYSSALSAAQGRQVFIHLPMQPDREERRAIIPETLRVGVAPAEIAQILEYSRRMVPDAQGLNNHMGSRFTSNIDATRVFCAELRKFWPQALVVDSLTHQGSVFYDLAWEHGLNAFRRSLFLDEENVRAAILRQLDNGLDLARQNGWAIVIGHPRQATLEALQVWLGYLDPEVEIAPLRAIR